MTMDKNKPQPPQGGLSCQHLTKISALNDRDLQYLLDLGQYYHQLINTGQELPQVLSGKSQANVFFENSTRTSLSFELAGKKLGAGGVTLSVATSSVNKGEELRDTVQTIGAMGVDAMVVRNKAHDTAQFIADTFEATNIPCAVINAGEGSRAHPTQALLDAVTILNSLGRSATDRLDDISLAICGDIRHSRVAGSNITLLSRLGAKIHLVAPKEYMPAESEFPEAIRFHSLKSGLTDCQFIMGLRCQFERMSDGVALNAETFYNKYGLNHQTIKLAAPGAKVLHPGPMNRGVEIDGALADDRSVSLILDQVANGVVTRMAVLEAFTTGTKS